MVYGYGRRISRRHERRVHPPVAPFGALFPVEGAADWLSWIMRFNPVTYAMEVLRTAFYASPSELLNNADFLRALTVTGGWSLLTMLLSVLIVRWRSDV